MSSPNSKTLKLSPLRSALPMALKIESEPALDNPVIAIAASEVSTASTSSRFDLIACSTAVAIAGRSLRVIFDARWTSTRYLADFIFLIPPTFDVWAKHSEPHRKI
ncbi:hypothetical protein DZB54_06075 [Herbaspirillum sp. 3R-3a1]|nr:hypothetical protein DZB54_06075 [Herbaspirillum sp. 3R-3a1]